MSLDFDEGHDFSASFHYEVILIASFSVPALRRDISFAMRAQRRFQEFSPPLSMDMPGDFLTAIKVAWLYNFTQATIRIYIIIIFIDGAMMISTP